MTRDDDISAGSRLGPYEILAPLGAGGMGGLSGADERLKIVKRMAYEATLPRGQARGGVKRFPTVDLVERTQQQ